MPRTKNWPVAVLNKQNKKRERGLEEQLATLDPPAKRVALEDASAPKSEDVKQTVAAMDPALLADHFAKCLRKCFPKKSSIEFEDDDLPTKAFLDTTMFDSAHTGANLPAFLEQFTKNGKAELTTCEAKASPHTLVITSSGMRTADLTRELRVFNTKNSKVAKLIAKHMKLTDNAKYLAETKIGIAIGTPARLKDLIDQDALETRGLRRIVVDGSYGDEKKRTIFDMDELFRPLMALLNVPSIRQRYGGEDQVVLLVY